MGTSYLFQEPVTRSFFLSLFLTTWWLVRKRCSCCGTSVSSLHHQLPHSHTGASIFFFVRSCVCVVVDDERDDRRSTISSTATVPFSNTISRVVPRRKKVVTLEIVFDKGIVAEGKWRVRPIPFSSPHSLKSHTKSYVCFLSFLSFTYDFVLTFLNDGERSTRR